MAGRRTVRQEIEHVAEMCAEHFPHGWRHVAEHQDAVACEHGEWTRPVGAATPVADATTESDEHPDDPEA